MAVTHEEIVVRSVDDAVVESLASELNISPIAARVLVGRGLGTFDKCKQYFRPDISQFHDPFLFVDMEKACERIFCAIRDCERIVVYGDYDVDGVTSTALLVRLLRHFGAICEYYLPNRLTEGYGLSDDGITSIAQTGAKLIITVDCGITACDEIALANKLGMQVIVTDHHEPNEILPPAFALLDPKCKSSGYPNDTLAGVGVALKLAQGLVTRMDGDDDLWTGYLDMAAVGTAADIVPLTGENRVIVSIGFAALSHTRNVGLAALLSAQGCAGKSVTTGDIVFRIAPCINATGRLGDSRRGVELLLTDNVQTAEVYAQELKTANLERRAIDSQIQQEVFAWADSHCNFENDFAIVAGSESWHCGVVGIVASKAVERYHRPVILFSIDETGMARGSGRSIPGFHLHDALSQCADLLEGFGGHAAAAGMSMKKENLETFRERFYAVAKAALTPADFIPKITGDADVHIGELTPKLFSLLKQMEPFGPGNMRPVFVCRNIKSKYAPKIVGSNHLKLMVQDGASSMDAVAFNFGDRIDDVRSAQSYTLAFSLDENEWNGRTTLQMKIRGVEV